MAGKLVTGQEWPQADCIVISVEYKKLQKFLKFHLSKYVKYVSHKEYTLRYKLEKTK